MAQLRESDKGINGPAARFGSRASLAHIALRGIRPVCGCYNFALCLLAQMSRRAGILITT